MMDAAETHAIASSADQVAFVLDRFQWTAPDRLCLEGAWDGVSVNSVADPVLIVHSGSWTQRLGAVDAPPTSARHWAATFSMPTAPHDFERAVLHVGDNLVVELPPPVRDGGRPRRRFGRVRLVVRELEPRDAASQPRAGVRRTHPVEQMHPRTADASPRLDEETVQLLAEELARTRRMLAEERATSARLRSQLSAANARYEAGAEPVPGARSSGSAERMQPLDGGPGSVR